MNSRSDFSRNLPGDPSALRSQTGRFQRWRLDLPLLLLLISLAAFGLFILYSASGKDIDRVTRQLIYLAIAFFGLIVVAQFKVEILKVLAPIGYIGGIVLLLLVAWFGDDSKGAQRWLDVFGIIRFQPSELMKIVVPLTVAWYLNEQLLPPSIKTLTISFFIAIAPSVLIILQPDLGTAILIAASGLFVLWLAGIGWGYILSAVLALLGAAWPIWHFLLHGYQRQRIMTLFNPESDRLGAGWNIIQSKTAIGSGGWDGKGWLNGTQSQLDFLPESHTDFIIAVLAEELGFVGVFLLLLLYLLIIIRGAQISLAAKTTFASLVAGSITLTFFVYIVVNMGMVSGVLPVVGVPLPLVSYGGTSLVTMLASFGILMAISAESYRR
ncbi:MAG: rod shape-determining protein RodA [Cellvibrionales bacterium]|nr:rod shape-determining protein RodA [Cellvibrionales bacterium]